MKHKSIICICKHIIISLGFVLFVIPLMATDVTVEPLAIQFNYDPSSSTNDAITIQSANEVIELPEWEYNGGNEIEKKFAYIKGQSNRNIRVYFDSNCTEPMHLFITLDVIYGQGIGTLCNYLVPNYTRRSWVILTLDGATPAYVGKHDLIWEWSIYAVPVGGNLCAATSVSTTIHEYYTVLAAPQSPMEIPWTEVLDYACVWAEGQTNAASAAQKIVEGLYNNTGFQYGLSSNFTLDRYGEDFHLTRMLSLIGGSGTFVNCYDMGKSLKIFGNAVGCNLIYCHVFYFGYVNCIKPIGRGWTNNPFYGIGNYDDDPIVGQDTDFCYGRSYFGNHSFCMLGTTCYDACLKVDTDGNPDHYLDEYGEPDGDGHIESWAYGWDWSTYKNKVIDDVPYYETSSPVAYSFGVY